jgi:predicted DNA-binding protein (MmcQ/YjbR family)
MSDPTGTRARLRRFALALPGAHEDHPWGESVVKVGKKIFVFLGVEGSAEPGIGVKVPTSQPLAVAQPGVVPMGYNLARSGWVGVKLDGGPPYEILREWVVESYRAVAPKRLAAGLDERSLPR